MVDLAQQVFFVSEVTLFPGKETRKLVYIHSKLVTSAWYDFEKNLRVYTAGTSIRSEDTFAFNPEHNRYEYVNAYREFLNKPVFEYYYRAWNYAKELVKELEAQGYTVDFPEKDAYRRKQNKKEGNNDGHNGLQA